MSDINGSNEIILPGENGIIVPPRNVDALYNAMVDMLENIEQRVRMAGKARELISSRYDCHIVRRALYDFYDSLEVK